MRIIHLAAGAGQMYCGACARDVAMLRGLMARGHDVLIIPLYTPLRIEGDEPLPTDEVHLGGINAWLQQHVPALGRAPAWVSRLLDSPALLRLAARFALSTRASELGEMTVSVLAGMDGRQARELDKLVAHLRATAPPDLFIITNSLLSGLAPALKRAFAVPVLCGLQGEDGFVQAMGEPHSTRARDLMRRNARDINLFLAPSRTYAEVMAEFLAVAPDRIRVVPTGVTVEDYRREHARPREPLVLGYLSVINHGKGLDLLVAAAEGLLAEGRDLRLRMAGRALDRPYARGLQRTLNRGPLRDRHEWLGEVDLPGKVRFLHECSAFSVPSRIPEARGVAVMEALAAGAPVVAPAAGVYPELLGLAPGGLLFEPGNASELAAQVARLQDDPDLADRLGAAGAQAMAEGFGLERVTQALLEALSDVVIERTP